MSAEPLWRDYKSVPMPLNKPVLVYLRDGNFNIGERLRSGTLVGRGIPIESQIIAWTDLPEPPTLMVGNKQIGE